MRFVVAMVMLLCAVATPSRAEEIVGSGSTLIFPVMRKWVDAYEKLGGVHVAYQPIGSAGGITAIRQGIVDFAVSEAPLESEQLLRDGLAQFPLVVSAIVPIVHVDGIGPGQLHVTGPLLADIFLGKIARWNDPAIAALNPELTLPNLAILVIHRTDGSGSTFVWADYLSKVSPEWSVRVGANTSIAWPTGIGGTGNSGVAEKVALVRGAIGYVDYGYAVNRNIAYAMVRNQAGNFVTPTEHSFQEAIAEVDWTKERDFRVLLTDAATPDAYPIMATSFGLIRKYPKDAGHARDILAFFGWTLQDGRDLAGSLNYSPLPPTLIQQIKGYWEDNNH
jgi:phosphate transport system substrate-binding protein